MTQTALAAACRVALLALIEVAEVASILVFAAAIGLWAGIWTGA